MIRKLLHAIFLSTILGGWSLIAWLVILLISATLLNFIVPTLVLKIADYRIVKAAFVLAILTTLAILLIQLKRF